MAKRSAAMLSENMPALGCAELGHATQPQRHAQEPQLLGTSFV